MGKILILKIYSLKIFSQNKRVTNDKTHAYTDTHILTLKGQVRKLMSSPWQTAYNLWVS